jgi:hypothetical protein
MDLCPDLNIYEKKNKHAAATTTSSKNKKLIGR